MEHRESKAGIANPWSGASVYRYEEIDSTNLEVLRRGRNGEQEGTVVIAEQQSAGRGRRGRQWESPSGVAVYMSVLLRPELEIDRAHILTPVSAYAIAKVLRKYGVDAGIKWPNDVVIGGRKICGILNELQIEEKQTYCVVTGIGINVNNRNFGETAGNNGTSLYLEIGRETPRDQLIEEVLRAYYAAYSDVNREGSLTPIREEYESLLVNCDRQVRILDPLGEWTGIARGINDMGELLVENDAGQRIPVSAGEVSVRGIYGYTK